MVTVGKLKNDGDLLLKGEINERFPIIYDRQTIEIKSKGYTASAPTLGDDEYIKIDGVVKLPIMRGVGIVRLDYFGNFVDATMFDTHSSVPNSDALATFINNTPDGYTLIFGTNDQPNPAGTGTFNPTGNLGIALSDLGFQKLNWNYRCAWAGIVKKGTRLPVFENLVLGDTVNTVVYTSQVIDKGIMHFPFDGTNISTQGLSPSIDTNTSLSYNGIAVEERTTNLWNGTLSIYNNYGQPASLTKLEETYLGQPVYRLKFRVTDPARLTSFQTQLHSHGVLGGYRTWLANTKYAVSIYWRPVNKQDIVFGGTASNMGGMISTPSEKLEDGWRRYCQYRNGTVTTDKADSIFFSFYCPSIQLNEDIYIDVCCQQTEEGRLFPTSYVNGSRLDGKLEVPLIGTNIYTISFKFTPVSPNNYADFVNWVFTHSPYNDFFLMWKRVTEDYYRIRINSSDFIFKNTDIVAGNKYTITFTSDGVNTRIFLNGVYKGEILKSYAASKISLGGDATKPGNNIFHSFSYYDRVLTDNEIKKLYDTKLSITKDGDVIGPKVIEKPTNIPSDTIHIPLDINSNDRLNLISPSKEIDTVYENGTVWVGTGTINEYKYPNFDSSSAGAGWSHWARAGGIGTYGQNTDPSFILSSDNQYSHWVENAVDATAEYLFYQSPEYEGGMRSLQAIICMSDGSPVTEDKIYPTWNARTTSSVPPNKWTSVERIGNSKWYLCKAEGVHQDGSSDLIGIFVRPGYKMYVDRIQVEQKPFCTPITLDSRGESSLEFNLNRDYQLDWSKDWSIVYWKKPVGTHTDDFTGYNIDSLGSGDNNVGGGYLWWGKSLGSNNIELSSPSTTDPLNYFNKWRMVSLTKTGSTITIREWSIDGTIHVRGVTTTSSVANFYVNQYGYDFKLGGYANGKSMNTYYKDLIIAKRALTLTELESMYKIRMKADKSKIQVSRSVHEGVL